MLLCSGMTSRVAQVMAPLLPGIRMGVGNNGLENGGGGKQKSVPWLFCNTNNFLFIYLFTTQILGAVAADLLYKSVPGLCLIISRAARYLPNPALHNIPSLFVYYNLYVFAKAR